MLQKQCPFTNILGIQALGCYHKNTNNTFNNSIKTLTQLKHAINAK